MTFCNLQMKYSLIYTHNLLEQVVIKVFTKGAPPAPYFVNVPFIFLIVFLFLQLKVGL
jgi:hypothetical protein